MELTLENDIEITPNLTRHPPIPETTARPVVRIWSVATGSKQAFKLKESLFELLPIYWSSQGIVDCKILEDSVHHNFIIIESWLDSSSQKLFELQPTWQQALKELRAQRHIRLREITNNIFELIE